MPGSGNEVISWTPVPAPQAVSAVGRLSGRVLHRPGDGGRRLPAPEDAPGPIL